MDPFDSSQVSLLVPFCCRDNAEVPSPTEGDDLHEQPKD